MPESDSFDEDGQGMFDEYSQESFDEGGQGLPPPPLSKDNPADLYTALLDELKYSREQRLLDMMDHGFQPISFEDNLLVLGYSLNNVDADDIKQLLDARCNVILQMTFGKICPHGKILLRRLTEDGLEEASSQVKSQRHATEAERKAMAERPVVRKLQEALNLEVIDARIDSRPTSN